MGALLVARRVAEGGHSVQGRPPIRGCRGWECAGSGRGLEVAATRPVKHLIAKGRRAFCGAARCRGALGARRWSPGALSSARGQVSPVPTAARSVSAMTVEPGVPAAAEALEAEAALAEARRVLLDERETQADVRDRAAEVRAAAVRAREAAAEERRARSRVDAHADQADRDLVALDQEWAARDRDEAAADRDDLRRLHAHDDPT